MSTVRKDRIFRNGYYMIHLKSHPNCTCQGYFFEHRYVMEQHIGRYLRKDEVVHHINHKRDDNRIENLIILSPSEHMKLHNAGKTLTEEHKKKIGLKHKGVLESKKAREKMRIAWIGRRIRKPNKQYLCIDCGTKRDRHSIRCKSCAQKLIWKENGPQKNFFR